MAGQPVLGSTLQPGGVELQLTLLNATTMKQLSDDDNPRPGEGLFLGRGQRPFKSTVLLTDKSSHKFMFYLKLLSSDIGGALMKIKVQVMHPNTTDAYDITRDFWSRAKEYEPRCKKRARSPESNNNS